jgi:hypothetical protein
VIEAPFLLGEIDTPRLERRTDLAEDLGVATGLEFLLVVVLGEVVEVVDQRFRVIHSNWRYR